MRSGRALENVVLPKRLTSTEIAAVARRALKVLNFKKKQVVRIRLPVD
jgi:hypothetical protein